MSFSNFPFEIKENNPPGPNIDELKKENSYLKAQIDAITREKDLHIAQHAEEKEQMKAHIRQLQDRIVFERNNFQRDIKDLTQQLESLKKSLERMVEFRCKIPNN